VNCRGVIGPRHEYRAVADTSVISKFWWQRKYSLLGPSTQLQRIDFSSIWGANHGGIVEYWLLTIRGNLRSVLVYSILGPKYTIPCITAKNYSPQWRFRPSVPGFSPTLKISGQFQDIYHAGNDQARVQDFFLFLSSLFTSPTRKQNRLNCMICATPNRLRPGTDVDRRSYKKTALWSDPP